MDDDPFPIQGKDVFGKWTLHDSAQRSRRPRGVDGNSRCPQHNVISGVSSCNLFLESNYDGASIHNWLHRESADVPLNLERFLPQSLETLGLVPRNLFSRTNDDLARQRVHDLLVGYLPGQFLRQGRNDEVANLDLPGLGMGAVLFPDHQFMGHIDEPARQVAGIRGLESCICLSLARSMGRQEVLQDGEALAEVRLNGELDDLAGRVRHQASDAGHLDDLLLASPGAGVGHDAHGVFLRQVAEDGLLNLSAFVLPDLHHLQVAVIVGKKTLIVEGIDLTDCLVCLIEDALPFGRYLHVGQTDGHAGLRSVLEPQGFDVVQQDVGPGNAKLP